MLSKSLLISSLVLSGAAGENTRWQKGKASNNALLCATSKPIYVGQLNWFNYKILYAKYKCNNHFGKHNGMPRKAQIIFTFFLLEIVVRGNVLRVRQLGVLLCSR